MSRKRNHATRRPHPPQPKTPPPAAPAALPNPDASPPELALSVGLRLRLGLSFSPSGRVGMVVDGILVALALYLGRRVYVLDPVWVSALADTPGEPPPGDHTDWHPVRGLTIVYVDDVKWMHLPTDPLPLDRMPPAPDEEKAPADLEIDKIATTDPTPTQASPFPRIDAVFLGDAPAGGLNIPCMEEHEYTGPVGAHAVGDDVPTFPAEGPLLPMPVDVYNDPRDPR